MHLLEKKKDEKATTTYQIFVPAKLQVPPVEWYHETLKQPGKTRTRQTIDQHYAWPEYMLTTIGRSEIKLRKDRIGSREFLETVRLEFCEELTKKLLVFENSALIVPEQKELLHTDSYG